MLCLLLALAAPGAWAQGAPEILDLLPGFDPSLEPVEIHADEGRGEVITEGKGSLRVTPDGRRILHLRGTPYEMGFQHGRLLSGEIHWLRDQILFKIGMVETVRSGEPFIETLRKILAACRPHIPPRYIEEARGLADGAGLPHEVVLLLNIFPERFHCSGLALFGEATRDGQLYHGRILDYMTNMGLQERAVVVVYEPDGGRLPWVNIGYGGFIGSVTGMNARGLSIGEMGGSKPGRHDGMPMTYLVREALETCETLDEALALFRDTPRTCEFYYVIADGKIPDARGLWCEPDRFEVIEPGVSHERLPHPVRDTVLLSAGDRYKRLAKRTLANHGDFSTTSSLALMRRPVAMRGCLHAVLFKPAEGLFWVADATPEGEPASEQPYVMYDLRRLLAGGRD